MPSLTLDKFDGGLDRRKGAATADANRMRLLTNAHVTTGHKLRKRPGTTLFATLEGGTKGLISSGGKLNTFHGSGASVTHANLLFRSHRVAHPVDDTRSVAKVHAGESFLGYPYVSIGYDDDSSYHHYLDADPTWLAATDYSVGDFVEPTVPNGYRYECTADAGSSDAAEPSWPEAVGVTVVDDGITWTCRSKAVADANCPHHPSIVRAASKIFSPNTTAQTTRYSATNAPRDWSSVSDAGFIPSGTHATGDPEPKAVGRYRNKLVIHHLDHTQVWLVDEDPSNIDDDEIVDVGTPYAGAGANVSQDLYFLSPFGFRSISTLEYSGNLQDLDVGSPVDELVVADLALTTDPRAIFFHGGGQYWCRMYGGVVWVFTYSRVSKVYAWSRYEFPFDIDDMAELNNELYLRSGNEVRRVDPSVFTDDGEIYPVTIQQPYLNAKKPGQLKQWMGADFVLRGTAAVSFLYDPDDEGLETAAVDVTGNTAADGMIPVECVSTELAPKLVNFDDGEFELELITLYYDVLGPM